jgi:hypothetical protein
MSVGNIDATQLVKDIGHMDVFLGGLVGQPPEQSLR